MFHGGTCMENNENAGISHLIEHLLLNLKDGQELNRYFDVDGVKVNGATSRESINIYGYFLEENKERYIQKLINTVFCEDFSDEMLEKNKKIVECEINQYNYLSKSAVLENSLLFKNSVWENDILGTIENINSFSAETVRKYRRKLLNEGTFVLALRGDIDYSDVEKYVHPYEIVKMKNARCDYSPCSVPAFNEMTYHNRKGNEPSNYSEISITYKLENSGKNELFPCLAVFNTMLTCLEQSVLSTRLREELKYVYQIYSYPELFHAFNIFRIRTRTLKENEEQVIEEITSVVERFCRNELDMQYLFEVAKNRVYNEILLQVENEPITSTNQLAKSVLFQQPTNAEVIDILETLDYWNMQMCISVMFNKLEKNIYINES